MPTRTFSTGDAEQQDRCAGQRRTFDLTNAMLKALTWLPDATDAEVADLVPAPYLMGDAELYRQAFRNIQPALSVNGRFPEQGAYNALQALQSFDPLMAQRQINLHATWTNQFVDQTAQP